MSNPPIYELAAAASPVVALLGSPIRFYPFGIADENTPRPYAVWQLISGQPENFLAGRPDLDGFSVQVDVYGKTPQTTRPVRDALRDAFEPAAYVTSWNGESRDPDTKDFRISFTADFQTPR